MTLQCVDEGHVGAALIKLANVAHLVRAGIGKVVELFTVAHVKYVSITGQLDLFEARTAAFVLKDAAKTRLVQVP